MFAIDVLGHSPFRSRAIRLYLGFAKDTATIPNAKLHYCKDKLKESNSSNKRNKLLRCFV